MKLVVVATVLLLCVPGAPVDASGRLSSGVVRDGFSSAIGKVKGASARAHRYLVTTMLVAATCASLLSCGDGGDGDVMSEEVMRESVKIGLNYTGAWRGVSRPGAKQGSELAVAQLNEAGGVHGVPIELIIKDNLGDTDLGVMQAEELAMMGDVNAFIGPGFSRIAIKIGEVAQRHRIPMVTISATNPAVTSAGNYVFMAAFTDDFQGRVMAKFANSELGAETAAVLTFMDDVYSEGLSQVFIDNFIALGGDIVAQEFYMKDTDDYGDQFAVIAVSDPDVVFIPGFVPDSPAAVMQGRQAGLDAVFLGGDGWDNAKLSEIGGDALEGSYFSTYFTASVPLAKASPETGSFINAYLDVYGVPPTGRAALGYDALRIVVEAMHRAGAGMSAEAIRAAIEATNNYRGATFLSGYDENRHAAKSAVVMTIRNGKSVYHRTVEP